MAIKNNKFIRQAELNPSKRNLSGEEKITIDAQLSRLEEDIRRLKIEYDIYFAGSVKRPPYDTKNRVENVIKRLADERTLTFAQRYHYNSMVSRYNAFRELWRRTLKDREEGRDAATLARSAAQLSEKKAEQSPIKTKFSCGNVHQETDTVYGLFNALQTAKTSCGQNAEDLTFNQFEQQLHRQTEHFKQNSNCERVAFEVGVEDGRVIFKARPE